MKLSVLIASSGRVTLQRAIDSARDQLLQDGDEILVHLNDDCPWGHASRNLMMRIARGDWFLFMDDDDAYAQDAFQKVRAGIAREPDKSVHIFKMDYGDHLLWSDETVRIGNVSTIMFCVAREVARNCAWAECYEGDFHFIQSAARLAGPDGVAFHDDVIALVRPQIESGLVAG